MLSQSHQSVDPIDLRRMHAELLIRFRKRYPEHALQDVTPDTKVGDILRNVMEMMDLFSATTEPAKMNADDSEMVDAFLWPMNRNAGRAFFPVGEFL